MSVYVITNGRDDDYHIITATDDIDLAYDIANEYNANVEIYKNPERYLLPCWDIEFDENGDITRIEKRAPSEAEFAWIGKCLITGDNRMYVTMRADTKEKAIAYGRERRARHLQRKNRK